MRKTALEISSVDWIRKIDNLSPYMRDELVLKIVNELVLSEAVTPYQLEKMTRMPHATLHKKIKEALQAKLIEVVETSKFRTGLQTKKYKLTPYGLIVYLAFCGSDMLVKKDAVYKKITELLFPKWEKFLKYVQEEYALQFICEVAEYLIGCPDNLSELMDSFFVIFISSFLRTNKHCSTDGIIAFIKSEPEYRQTFIKHLDSDIEHLNKRLDYLRKIKEQIGNA
ncbi:MAG: hypothetical protein QW279_13465 [Candidatus Jordarchaeaceae archaeon]